jgi:hypothetical protein
MRAVLDGNVVVAGTYLLDQAPGGAGADGPKLMRSPRTACESERTASRAVLNRLTFSAPSPETVFCTRKRAPRGRAIDLGASSHRPQPPPAKASRCAARSRFFCTLPMALRGSSAAKNTRFGTL